MKIKLPIALIALMLPAVLYAAPPVDVEIADEEAKDFFSSEPEEEEEGVKKNADDAFEELEATEKGAKIKRKKRARSEGDDSDDNSNINQNVVNVMVVTGDKDTKVDLGAFGEGHLIDLPGHAGADLDGFRCFQAAGELVPFIDRLFDHLGHADLGCGRSLHRFRGATASTHHQKGQRGKGVAQGFE